MGCRAWRPSRVGHCDGLMAASGGSAIDCANRAKLSTPAGRGDSGNPGRWVKFWGGMTGMVRPQFNQPPADSLTMTQRSPATLTSSSALRLDMLSVSAL